MTESPQYIRPRLVDFHCHLDLYPDHTSLLKECDRDSVATLAVTTTPKAWKRNHLLASHSKMVRAALGFHPQLAEERAAELPMFEKLLGEARYVGEVGLDAGPRFYKSMPIQERIFAHILGACREHGGKVLSIHSVRSASKVMDYLEASLPPDRGKCVLHWFTGSSAEAKRAIDYGCYFSINSQMLSSSKHCSLVASLPSERLLTETDGPFVERDGRPVRPRDVEKAVHDLAAVRDTTHEDMSKTILQNLLQLLSPGEVRGHP